MERGIESSVRWLLRSGYIDSPAGSALADG
jgi:hypothetical protein